MALPEVNPGTTLNRDFSEVYQFMDDLPVAIYSCDKNGYITRYNEAAVNLWGRTPELGKDLWCGSWKIFDTDGVSPVSLDTCPMAIALKTGVILKEREIIIERPDGSRRNVIPFPRPIFDEKGNITGAFNMLHDISEHKQTESQNATLIAIVESSDDAIISKNFDSIVTSWNKAAEKIFGYTAEEIIGRSITILIPPDRAYEEAEIISALKKGNHVDHFETKRRRKDGKIIDISLTISPVKDSSGNVIGISKIARDITEQKQLHDELKVSELKFRNLSEELDLRVTMRTKQLHESNSQLESSNRDLEQFAFTASHDLQEPLRKIQTFTNILSERVYDKVDQKSKECIEKINAAALRMSALIGDLLNFSRITRNEKEKEIVNLNDVVRNVTGDLELMIERKNATIHIDKLPVVRAYALQMNQLFYNLLGNALKFSRAEIPPQITITSEDLLKEELNNYGLNPERRYFRIEISDNGIGFDPAFEKSIFDLFQRLHMKHEYEGTGIGLALCNKIVKNHNGLIYAKSEENKGATFYVILPL
ncbi:PAS domain S-box protein [Flavihumibacter solisilvae]|uniref:PAS domain-containing sensor histidine kinase n=1 Tax=Flavihumibacter solisilvae TaxID=1349421 RepID=UPI00068A1DF3|nr:PAS domain S-box protein [Flavihumibacter solisilvae]